MSGSLAWIVFTTLAGLPKVAPIGALMVTLKVSAGSPKLSFTVWVRTNTLVTPVGMLKRPLAGTGLKLPPPLVLYSCTPVSLDVPPTVAGVVPLPTVVKVTLTGLAEAALKMISFTVGLPSATLAGVMIMRVGKAVPSLMVPVPVAGVPIVAPLPVTVPIVAVKFSVGSPGKASAIVGTLKFAVIDPAGMVTVTVVCAV